MIKCINEIEDNARRLYVLSGQHSYLVIAFEALCPMSHVDNVSVVNFPSLLDLTEISLTELSFTPRPH